MKSTIASGILLVVIHVTGISQEKNVTLTMPGKEVMIDRIHLGEPGFILKTSERLLYYSATCDLIWEKKVKTNYAVRENLTVASPDGSVVYHVEGRMDNFLKKTQYITQIKKDGQLKEVETIPSKAWGNLVISVFCDNNYLYYLTLDESKEKKSNEVMVLNRFDAATLKYSKVSLGLPAKPDSYWYFLGQKDNVKYIANKDIEKQRPENTVTIVGFTADGVMVSTVSIPVSLADKFIRPALNSNAPTRGWTELKDNDFRAHRSSHSVPGNPSIGYNPQNLAYGTGPRTMTTYSGSTEYSSASLLENPGAFCHISMNEETGSFYLFGLVGPKAMNKSGIANVYEGFYIFKFNGQGNNVWKLQHNGSAELEEEKFFRVHGMAADRHLNVVMLPREKLGFTIRFRKTRVSYSVSEEGKIVTSGKQENLDWLPGSHVSNSYSPPANRSEKSKSDDIEKSANFFTSKGEVVMHMKQVKDLGTVTMIFKKAGS